MQKTYSQAQAQNPVEIMRKAGYSYFKDPQSGEESFVARLTPEFYPRFHVYIKHQGDQVTFDLHLDQKKPSYGQNNLHSGEYTGPVIEKEMSRIESWVRAVSKLDQANIAEHDADTKAHRKQATGPRRWWQNLFR